MFQRQQRFNESCGWSEIGIPECVDANLYETKMYILLLETLFPIPWTILDGRGQDLESEA